MTLFEKMFGEFFANKQPNKDNEYLMDVFSPLIAESAQEVVDKYLESLSPVIKFEKLSEDAIIPTYADEFAEGMDLYSPVNVSIAPKGQVNIKLGIKAEIPEGYWLKFESRSGLAWKNGLAVGAGVIDGNYNAELGLVLYNHSQAPYMIAKGDRVAQAVAMRHNQLRIAESAVKDGTRDGFGSTGK